MITNSNTLGLYIHIPFCVRKCRYCDFLSFPNSSEDLISIYIEKLTSEIIAKNNFDCTANIVDSIYIGGGTPSLIEANYIDDILDAIYAKYNISDNTEITIEANPGTVDVEKLKSYANFGINRLSYGVQSFDRKQLKLLGRIHDSDSVLESFNLARNAGFKNINIDLIFGLPEETLPIWLNDVKTTIELSPEHISFYSLTIEENTPIFHDIINARIEELDETSDRIMYHKAIELLADNGYNHYEISNAALPGFESRHNLKYWSMNNYLGFGLGAHSYVNGVRFANTESMQEYLSADGSSPMTTWVHENTITDEISEFVFLGLRKIEGIDLKRFNTLFGKSFWEVYSYETKLLIERGLLEENGDMLRLTSLGLDLSNQVFMEYI